MNKKIVASVLTFSMMAALSVPAFAAERLDVPKVNSPYIIMWSNTDRVSSTLNFTGNRADCSAIIEAKSGATKIKATILLKQVTDNGTKTVKTWTKTVSGDELLFDKSYYVASGHSYELEVNANIYRNGTVENVSITDSDSC
ncbi:hypothetical protein [Faecalispora anaeroviscerum]|uniref:hypothetical protein n=1 Tax=Faecalispora anaeroviscerum TaxID=2991836 RepID=UPI0024BA466C|nr:hypothetical protein [Faecalispora anaeroviscerum]